MGRNSHRYPENVKMGIKLALLNGSLLHIQSRGFITERLWSQNHEHSFTSTGSVGLPYLGQSNSFPVREVNGFENMSQQESRQRPSWQLLKRSEFCQFAGIIKTDDVLFAFFRLCHKTFTFTFFPSLHPSNSVHSMLTKIKAVIQVKIWSLLKSKQLMKMHRWEYV